MISILKWASGFFSDNTGMASRKAAAGYWGLLMLTYMIVKSVNGAVISMEIFTMVISFTAGMYGLILLERFGKQTPPVNPDFNPEPEKKADAIS